MFNGVPEQFHQFIASRSALPLPLPLTLPLHAPQPPPSFSIHDHEQHHVFQPHLLHQLHQQHEDNEKEEEVNLEQQLDGMRSSCEVMDPWLKEEVLALLSIRSSLGNEFSDFIWGHVSRKLGELGFKRSAEKCKEKFEEVSKYCNNSSYGNYYRSFNELEALFEDQNPPIEKMVEENSANETLENPIEEVKKPKRKKNKKKQQEHHHHQLELLKGFSEFVNKIMAQQEELHKKLLQDMDKREEERVAREEAWKKKEMDKFYKEMEVRAQEQAATCNREAKIIEFLNQFTTSSPPCSNIVLPENPSPVATTSNNSNPNNIPVNAPPQPPHPNPNATTSMTMNEREDYGKRWPRDEVNSLINLRCNLQSNGVDSDKESTKAPLWERISQGMLELGYRRSAKKCKEKWENINKYFRKTKDANKKRPLDSKTCPYFHQLNTLYNQGRLTIPSDGPENITDAQESRQPDIDSLSEAISHHVNHSEKNMVQVPLEFDY